MRTERPAIGVGQAGAADHLAHHRSGDVALGVPGADKHERHGRDMSVPLIPQGLDRVGQRRRRELDEAPAGVHGGVGVLGQPQPGPVHQGQEIPYPVRIFGAMPHDEQGRVPGH